MKKSLRAVLGTLLVGASILAAVPAQAHGTRFTPGAAGVGDPYYPLDGNGGYDVRHYDLELAYDPPTDRLTGVATVRARATQNLSRFDLDLVGLTVRSVTVDGRRATWRRDGQELVVTPRRGLHRRADFTVVVRYDGVPETLNEDGLGVSGFLHTEDGQIVAGQPHSAATWFPVNDHPSDKAAYTFHVTAPSDLDVIANGVLTRKRRQGATTRWTWRQRDPMASYLATVNSGRFDVTERRVGGLPYLDAIHEDLFEPFAEPRTGEQYAVSQLADDAYKRLTRTITVPAGGATLDFQLARDVEEGWDHVFVEAHRPGQDDWTTLPDANGHTTQEPGAHCEAEALEPHPFLLHYLTLPEVEGGPCTPTGTTGEWWAATGSSDGYEAWSVDLSDYAGGEVEVSISYASDFTVQGAGLYLDDVVVSTGEGSTSFEADADPLDGWTVPGPPEGSPGNANDWIAGPTFAEDLIGDSARASLDREPDVIAFLSERFGRYPFDAVGGIVPADDRLGFALETQTRPLYTPGFFGAGPNTSVVTHELAHQWFGDSVSVRQWRDIWLNEGFATYAEWLWSENEGGTTAQEIFEGTASIPADDPFWQVVVADPGPADLFSGSVYDRGAMALHALRTEVGDAVFFRILRTWAASQAGGNVTTSQFVRLAERLSGRDLDALFDTWVYQPVKPAGLPEDEPSAARSSAGSERAPHTRGDLLERFGDGKSAR